LYFYDELLPNDHSTKADITLHKNKVFLITRVGYGTYLCVPFPSHSNSCPSRPIPWNVSNGIPIGMTFQWRSLGLSMGHIYLSHSHPIAIYACPIPPHPMGRFPWDSHKNPIPMDKRANHCQSCFHSNRISGLQWKLLLNFYCIYTLTQKSW